MIKIVAFQGPSGAGKTTLQKRLNIPRIISWTSREQRHGEQNGVHYFFTSREYLTKMNESGQLLEMSEYQGNLYATKLETVKDLENTHSIVVDASGANSLRGFLGSNLLTVGVYARLADCKERLLERNDSGQSISRLVNFSDECGKLLECDMIINNSICNQSRSLTIIDSISMGLQKGM